RRPSGRHVVTWNGEFLHARRIHSPSTRFGDRNGTDPSHSGTKCTVVGRLWNAHGSEVRRIIIMFDELPETIPHKHTKKLKAFGTALALQSALVLVLIILQMAMPEKLGHFELISTLHMAPPVPPPPPAPVSPAPKQVQHIAPKTAPDRESAPVVQQ